MDPNYPCVFCNLFECVKEYGFVPGVHHNGWPIYWITPINPVTDGHKLIVPQQHVAHANDDPKLFGVVMEAAALYVRNEPKILGYNIIQSNGVYATQSVFHLHVHVVPRRPSDGLKLPWSDQHG